MLSEGGRAIQTAFVSNHYEMVLYVMFLSVWWIALSKLSFKLTASHFRSLCVLDVRVSSISLLADLAASKNTWESPQVLIILTVGSCQVILIQGVVCLHHERIFYRAVNVCRNHSSYGHPNLQRFLSV